MAKKLSRYEQNLKDIIAERVAKEGGKPTPEHTQKPQAKAEKAKNNVDSKTITQGITTFIVLAAGFWVWWHFIRVPAPDSSNMPPDEQAFVSLVTQARGQWNAAPNSVAQAPMRPARDAAICKLLTSQYVNNWIGNIKNVDASSTRDKNGKLIASIDIAISPNITISTPPSIGIFADPSVSVEQGSAIYQTVSALADGSAVTFSGQFQAGSNTCISELSLTDNGSMTSPDFEMALKTLTSGD